jgi:hypothetical protein
MTPTNTNPAGNPRVGKISSVVVGKRDNPVPAEFERFENLARKLARVPKSEVDEKRQKA